MLDLCLLFFHCNLSAICITFVHVCSIHTCMCVSFPLFLLFLSLPICAASSYALCPIPCYLTQSHKAEDKPAALESAVSLYALAAEANPSNSAGAHYGRGVCLRKLGRHAEAITCFQVHFFRMKSRFLVAP